ncbi:MAG: hypothetical protein AB1750_14050, partial [Chloroflexota bacterium]
GCAPTGEAYPTPIPPDVLPTAIYETAVAANATMFALTPSPTFTPLPTFTSTPEATFTPTVTLTPTAVPLSPNTKIFVAAPGPMSKVASPMQLKVEVRAPENHLVDISLFGEDGRLIARELIRILSEPPTVVFLNPKIPFEVRAAELGHLQIVTKDRAGRIEALSTTFLLLLPIGQSEINPPPPVEERANFAIPQPDSIVTGGVLLVEGTLKPFNDIPASVVVKVEDENRNTIGERVLSITGDEYASFSIQFPYAVTAPTLVRLSIYQTDPRVDGIIYLFSQLVTLAP